MKNDRSHVNIEITVTNSCNCNCKYCFEPNHNNTSNREEELRQLELLLKYCNEFDITKHDSLNITFWGGEPMLNTQFLYDIIETTYKYPFVRYMMYTNGTMVDRFIEFINKDFIDSILDRFTIQLSYDGEPHHTLMRHDNRNFIFKTTDLLIDRGFKSLSFKATLSFNHLNLLPQVWESYKELHEKYDFVQYSPTLDQSNSSNSDVNFEIWKKVVLDVAKKEMKFIEQHGYPLWSWFTNPGKLVCSMNNGIHIHNDGNLYICHGCPYCNNSKMFIIGNTKDIKSLEDVLNNGFNISLRHKKCVKCSAVACQVCHVSELDKDIEKVTDYKENWTRIVVNNEDRCRFFKYFGLIYNALLISTIIRG